MQGELRLYKAASPALANWSFVNVLFATNETAGRTLDNAMDNTWASQMRDCPTCPLHSVSNSESLFETECRGHSDSSHFCSCPSVRS